MMGTRSKADAAGPTPTAVWGLICGRMGKGTERMRNATGGECVHPYKGTRGLEGGRMRLDNYNDPRDVM